MINNTAIKDIDETIKFIRSLNLENERLCNLKDAYPPEYISSSSQANQRQKNGPPICKKDRLDNEDDGLEELLKEIESYVNEDIDKNISTSFNPNNKPFLNGYKEQINSPPSYQHNEDINNDIICQSTHKIEKCTNERIVNVNETERQTSSINMPNSANNDILSNHSIAVPCYQLVHMDTLHFCTLASFHMYDTSFGLRDLAFIQHFECLTCGSSWFYYYPVLYL